MNGETVKGKVSPDKSLELINGDGEDLDVDYLEDLEDDVQENERVTDADEHGNNYENNNLVQNLECQNDNMPISHNVKVMNRNDLQLLQKISNIICQDKNTLLAFLVHIAWVTATARRTLLKDTTHLMV